ncbi:RNA-directed DNA polymerase, eukaryota [Tanacetum coccineum]
MAAESVTCPAKLMELDKAIDQGCGNDDILNQRDDNSKYFHGILNSKRTQLAIRGILMDGDWIVEPTKIKKADWECGTNKSPGPGGFSFEFFQKYWNIVDKDVIHDAKVVKDFCPISLIGSMYKIIDKILANRPSFVMLDLISDDQTTFVANPQILDGPFILNELISWCKLKKVKTMIFKVDFEKAFDYVGWDYLDDVLKSFGFGDKWCSWISSCLNSAKGLVLVNGSPTSEFKFHKGLKQGDPLSSFIFILVMESLHLSFKRLLEVRLFKGISINNSLMISYLFYADDVIFVGKWDISNINTFVHVLKCFFLAFGLKIIQKSKLMRIGVQKEDVVSAALIIGCSMFFPLFNYLGVLSSILGKKS